MGARGKRKEIGIESATEAMASVRMRHDNAVDVEKGREMVVKPSIVRAVVLGRLAKGEQERRDPIPVHQDAVVGGLPVEMRQSFGRQRAEDLHGLLVQRENLREVRGECVSNQNGIVVVHAIVDCMCGGDHGYAAVSSRLTAFRAAQNTAQHTAQDLAAELAANGAHGLLGQGFDHALAAVGAPKQVAEHPTALG